ncbi:U5 small nuclear ribonucleoprotein TSSC4 [Formica fusca]
MHTSANFILRGGDAAFANRQRLLFDQLSIAENSCNKRVRSEVDDEMDECERNLISRDDQKQKRETKKFRGKESIFKRPEGPAPRTNFRNIPDYHRNPHKWVKYSLDDVSSEDMTERSNMQAAMSFLKELKARRENEEDDECEEKMDIEFESDSQDSVQFKSKKRTSTSIQIRFRKPQTKDAEENSETTVTDSTLVFKSSKIILPEYVVGQRPKKISKQNRPVVKVDRSKQLRLDHLQEPDEEEDNRDV